MPVVRVEVALVMALPTSNDKLEGEKLKPDGLGDGLGVGLGIELDVRLDDEPSESLRPSATKLRLQPERILKARGRVASLNVQILFKSLDVLPIQ